MCVAIENKLTHWNADRTFRPQASLLVFIHSPQHPQAFPVHLQHHRRLATAYHPVFQVPSQRFGHDSVSKEMGPRAFATTSTSGIDHGRDQSRRHRRAI
ncbi:hypothetical protein BO82DRAFT_352550 [Aspergillus uvarum CBS 121591]|uniref:Uncharacterized protein n=1 Tax=Aspergillus uvarum CBS 121591 TaxID=1448315 RepID=A0A319CH86_9EURO|nr:hypothetical protein BO82DRAFT_352550 [Aspergillus uvarum CBS 121591]PYH83810.1 hypothetical protein BO82DRAFT_352550 [Aspergillus uvarum CBS 121591]